ncbi:MAG: haloacid dehalogenase-like hydrolase [Erysipelotrichia bacterium]|nr:haloacid dehalogenase-like hydrolase [Erysipelotrichia bacterium]
MKKPIIAMMYDFDKTLCTKDMQEYSFIPRVNMDSQNFWQEVTKIAEEDKMDRILSYMYYMLEKAKAERVPIRKHDFMEAGENIELFPGVLDFFERMNAYGDALGIQIEHYIISSGLKEIIEGSQLKDKFKKIYACGFHYDVNGVADWPSLVVNYTNKTQFLFRINKGVLDVFEDEQLNEFVEDIDRRIPFRNMIYLGDGLTDVPCMKLVKENGGQSIAVYTEKNKVENLLVNRRVDFICKADYQEGSELDETLKLILQKMSIVNQLVDKNHAQRKVRK